MLGVAVTTKMLEVDLEEIEQFARVCGQLMVEDEFR